MMIVNFIFLGIVIFVIRFVGFGVSFYKVMISYVWVSFRIIFFIGCKVFSIIFFLGYYLRFVECYLNFYLLKELFL